VTTLDAYCQGGKSVRNWGRWGADGQLGTLNFIDAATLAQYLPGVENLPPNTVIAPGELDDVRAAC
jgi:hypothetical protein